MRDSAAVDLLDRHPVFVAAASRIRTAVRSWGALSIDDLVVLSRTPLRTALLVVDHLESRGELEIGDGVVNAGAGRTPRPLIRRDPPVAPFIEVEARYLSLAEERETPVLVWGQRRLIPESAVDRARHLLSLGASVGRDGLLLFLGDDDLVSPLAAVLTGWRTVVVDIDAEVLRLADTVAAELGTAIETVHGDLSAVDLRLGLADIVVADPFPSGDGSFESLFWSRAAESLTPEGLLVSTVAPSHKPVDYAQGALNALTASGYYPVDLKAEYGKYEVFDFELVRFERDVVERMGGKCSVSHTKSLVTARLNTDRRSDKPTSHFSFDRWTAAALSHYLTRQAGVEEQRQIAMARGVGKVESPDRTEVADERGPAADSHLGLALRAIESWERWRLDD